MKKLLILQLIILMAILSTRTVQAADYLAFQKTEFKHSGPRFLNAYTKAMYDEYYPKVTKRKFWGWRTHTAYKTETVYYTRETLYYIHNEGESPITETFRFEENETIKKQYNASGSLALDESGEVYGFKLGLESKLDHSMSASSTTTKQEEITIKVIVDPGTRLTVTVEGEGEVSNGVAAYYSFWVRLRKGGWEIFTITTEYYSLVKEEIDETAS
jgi:hypothetical protein